ncbi:DNA polymerase, partial [Listeria seeligeri FSL N1-067]
MMYSNVPDVLSQLIRTAFIAEDGYTFDITDFSAIEARVIAWLAGEQWRLDVFNSHGKIYEASASQMFHIPIEEVDKNLRQ